MYLWHILCRDDSELIKRVYNAQKFSPGKSDWIHQVINDKSFLGLNLSDDDIQLFNKSHFKKIIDKKIENKRKQDQRSTAHPLVSVIQLVNQSARGSSWVTLRLSWVLLGSPWVTHGSFWSP